MRQLQKLNEWFKSDDAVRVKSRIRDFLKTMDNKNFILLPVCVLPGWIAVEVVSAFNIPQPGGMIATGILLIGLIVYWKWAKIRKSINKPKDGLEDSANDQEYVDEDMDVPAMMKELVALYGGDEAAANRAINVELQMDRELNWDGGVFMALRRKQTVDQLASRPR